MGTMPNVVGVKLRLSVEPEHDVALPEEKQKAEAQKSRPHLVGMMGFGGFRGLGV